MKVTAAKRHVPKKQGRRTDSEHATAGRIRGMSILLVATGSETSDSKCTQPSKHASSIHQPNRLHGLARFVRQNEDADAGIQSRACPYTGAARNHRQSVHTFFSRCRLGGHWSPQRVGRVPMAVTPARAHGGHHGTRTHHGAGHAAARLSE